MAQLAECPIFFFRNHSTLLSLKLYKNLNNGDLCGGGLLVVVVVVVVLVVVVLVRLVIVVVVVVVLVLFAVGIEPRTNLN